MTPVQYIPYEHRFQPDSFDDREVEIIIGALNRYGCELPAVATKNNLSIFTWDQVQTALIVSRRDCVGDSRDDVDDVIYNLRAERASYVN